MADPLSQQKGKRNHNHQILCIQVNLQHSKAATNNLMQVMSAEGTVVALIQEPYLYQSKPTGITSRCRMFTAGEGKSRAAIVISDATRDAMLIAKLSGDAAVLLEINNGQTQFYAASIYLNYNDPIGDNIKTMEKIVKFTKGAKLIMAIDSNSRSTTWHGVLNNFRGKEIGDFPVSNQLHIINEDSRKTTFHSSRGSSNIDLTIGNNQMIADIRDWEISEERCSHHTILKFAIHFNTYNKEHRYTCQGKKYIMKKQAEFSKILHQMISKNFHISSDEENTNGIDEFLKVRLTQHNDIREFMEIYDKIQSTCKAMLKHQNTMHTTVKGKTVPWWTEALTKARKQTPYEENTNEPYKTKNYERTGKPNILEAKKHTKRR